MRLVGKCRREILPDQFPTVTDDVVEQEKYDVGKDIKDREGESCDCLKEENEYAEHCSVVLS